MQIIVINHVLLRMVFCNLYAKHNFLKEWLSNSAEYRMNPHKCKLHMCIPTVHPTHTYIYTHRGRIFPDLRDFLNFTAAFWANAYFIAYF